MAAGGKRSSGVSSRQSYGFAAHRILQAALKDVRRWLALAAKKRCDDDGENVHHLRVSTRRAGVAVNSFSDLIGTHKSEALKDKLRQIRKAADEARNIDVTTDRFMAHCGAGAGEPGAKLCERLSELRKQAQAPIVAIHAELTDGKFDASIAAVLRDAQTRCPKLAKERFGKQARGILKPALKHFFKSASPGIRGDKELHRLRIDAKKLRYTMDIVASAFPPAFGGKLYRRISKYQDILGAIRDHVIAEDLLREWLSRPCKAAERSFLQGLLASEKQAHEELKKAFHTAWTKKTVEKLGEKFDELMK